MKLKPPADATDFKWKFIERAQVLSGRKYAEAHLICPNLFFEHGRTKLYIIFSRYMDKIKE